MKKRIACVLLCLILLAGLSSCGDKGENDTSDSNVFSPDGTVPQAQSQVTSSEETENTNTVKITVPEGYTLLKTAWLLEENGVCSTAAFLEATQNYDMSQYSVLSALSTAQNVCFRLEGYLFPATYTFEKNAEPNAVVKAMVSTMEQKFTPSMRQRATELGYSVHDILTIASIIEKEAFTEEQRSLISSTIYNRLKKGMKLEYDVTTKYCTGVIEVQYPEQIDHYKYYYNGYRASGIIAGPICNPGLSSINAALYPAETDYLYFVIDTNPPYESAFAATFEEHQQNCKRMGY